MRKQLTLRQLKQLEKTGVIFVELKHKNPSVPPGESLILVLGKCGIIKGIIDEPIFSPEFSTDQTLLEIAESVKNNNNLINKIADFSRILVDENQLKVAAEMIKNLDRYLKSARYFIHSLNKTQLE